MDPHSQAPRKLNYPWQKFSYPANSLAAPIGRLSEEEMMMIFNLALKVFFYETIGFTESFTFCVTCVCVWVFVHRRNLSPKEKHPGWV